MLHVVIVGGGPTGVEFAGELSNFINKVSCYVSYAAKDGRRIEGFSTAIDAGLIMAAPEVTVSSVRHGSGCLVLSRLHLQSIPLVHRIALGGLQRL